MSTDTYRPIGDPDKHGDAVAKVRITREGTTTFVHCTQCGELLRTKWSTANGADASQERRRHVNLHLDTAGRMT